METAAPEASEVELIEEVTADESLNSEQKGIKRTAEELLSGKQPAKIVVKKSRRLSQVKESKGAMSKGRAASSPPPQEAEALTFGAFKKYMDSTFGAQLKGVQDDLKDTRKELGGKVDEIAGRLDSQENDVADLQRSVLRLEEAERKRTSQTGNEVTKAVEAQVRAAVARFPVRGDRDQEGAPTRLENEFLRARRSLKLWPIKGNSAEELWVATGDFLIDVLRVRESEVDQNHIESVTRPNGQSPRDLLHVKDEAVVVFKSAMTRDLVLRASSNLSSYRDRNGNPTAGLRLEIPRHMKGTFNLLERYGHFMRQRYGKGTKTHIKFDEAELNLFTSVRLPGETEWARITPIFARKTLRNREETVSESWEARYGCSSSKIDADPGTPTCRTSRGDRAPRSASESDVSSAGPSTSRRPWAPPSTPAGE